MRRTLFALIVAALSIAIFAACGETLDEVVYDDYEYVEIEEIEEIEEEPAAEIAQTATWQEAYKAILQDYYDKWRVDLGGSFILHDIDGDGVPELIVVGNFDAVYTFRNGEVLSLKYGENIQIAGTINAARTRAWAAPDNGPGLIFSYNGPAGRFGISSVMHWRIIIDGDGLIVDADGERYVDVNTLLGLYDENVDWDAFQDVIQEHTHWYLNDAIVSEEDFRRVFVGGEMLWPLQINEDNIQNAISDWQPPWPSWQEAYAALLRHYAETTHFDRFFLHDIDGDGVPELIVGHFAGSLRRMWFEAAYTFVNGRAVEIGGFGYFANGGGIFVPQGGREGIAIQSYGSTLLLAIEYGALVTEISLHGPHHMMRHIEGWTINDKEATEAEFDAARDEIIGEMGNRTGIWPEELVEDNISDAIFGWRPIMAAWQEAYAYRLLRYTQFPSYCGRAVEDCDCRHFILHDIDGDGIPELIITNEIFIHTYFVAYTFADGILKPIGHGRDLVVEFFALPNDRRGIITSGSWPYQDFLEMVVMAGYRLTWDFRSTSGKDLINGQYFWRINGAEVTEQEHDDRIYNMLGNRDDWQRISRYEVTEDNIRDVIANWQPVAPTRRDAWRDAYGALLRHYERQVLGYLPSGSPNYSPGGTFILFDIDGDGIPELIVRDRDHFTSYFAVYTFRDGALLRLEAEYFYDYGTRFFPLPGNRQGIGMGSNEGVWDSIAALVIDGDGLVLETTLRRGEGDDGIWWRLNGEYITEEEHASAEELFFGRWEDRRDFFWPSAGIDEQNILDIVFRWSRPTTVVN